MTKHKIPEGEDGQEPFAEMLGVMDTEQLIRMRHRLNKIGRKKMVKFLTDEIEEREKKEAANRPRNLPGGRLSDSVLDP